MALSNWILKHSTYRQKNYVEKAKWLLTSGLVISTQVAADWELALLGVLVPSPEQITKNVNFSSFESVCVQYKPIEVKNINAKRSTVPHKSLDLPVFESPTVSSLLAPLRFEVLEELPSSDFSPFALVLPAYKDKELLHLNFVYITWQRCPSGEVGFVTRKKFISGATVSMKRLGICESIQLSLCTTVTLGQKK